MAVQEVDAKVLELEAKRSRDRLHGENQRQQARRQKLELLQQDNHFEDPHKNLVLAKNLPQFDEADRKSKKSRKTKLSERWKKTFPQALQEEERFWTQNPPAEPTPNYFSAEAGPPRYPPLIICSVCSMLCNMKCVTCEDRFCSRKCLEVHKEMRCQKRVV